MTSLRRSGRGGETTSRDVSRLRELMRLDDSSALSRGELGFTTWEFAHISLPYRDPGPAIWSRTNQAATLTVMPAVLQMGGDRTRTIVPYGKIPRATLLWLLTEAKRTGEQTITLGDSLHDFLKRVGLSVGGSQYGHVVLQLRALFGCSMSVSRAEEREGGTLFKDAGFRVADEAVLFVSHRDRVGMDGLLPSYVTLSNYIYRSVMERGIPVDLGAWEWINSASNSPLALDLYVFLASRLYRIKSSTFLSWKVLELQFGSQYSRTRDFKAAVLDSLRLVADVYPQAKIVVDHERGGLWLRPSPPAVAPKK